MTRAALDQLLANTSAGLGQLIEQAKQWQPLLAGLLVALAAIIFAAGIVRAAKIRAATAGDRREKLDTRDLRTATPPRSVDTETLASVGSNLEALRSLVRSALSSLSSVDTDHDAARSFCVRIAGFQGRHFSLPVNADRRTRETYATFLKQFEILQRILDKEWSPSEASATLIQLNASARALYTSLKQTESHLPGALNQQNKN